MDFSVSRTAISPNSDCSDAQPRHQSWQRCRQSHCSQSIDKPGLSPRELLTALLQQAHPFLVP
eukprot:3074612-Amphidinium_carterae.1